MTAALHSVPSRWRITSRAQRLTPHIEGQHYTTTEDLTDDDPFQVSEKCPERPENADSGEFRYWLAWTASGTSTVGISAESRGSLARVGKWPVRIRTSLDCMRDPAKVETSQGVQGFKSPRLRH